MGRSRGGWTSKIHVVVDALGSQVRWLLTGGEVADITQAKSLLEGLKTDAVLADKGYDADALIDSIIGSSNSEESQLVMKSWRVTTCRFSIWFVLIFGLLDC
ncbi:hypothetical protein D5045_18035 [Verminephrobacter eiseniae]|nr:hypothetical protein [Verminephrobacter eiseniae]